MLLTLFILHAQGVGGLSRKSPTIVHIMRPVCVTVIYTGSQGEWTGMCMHVQWRLHYSQRGWWVLMSEHVYSVVIAFKITEQVQQWICIKFCIKLEHSSPETIQMIQKAAAMGNWWLAALSQQCASSCITEVSLSYIQGFLYHLQ